MSGASALRAGNDSDMRKQRVPDRRMVSKPLPEVLTACSDSSAFTVSSTLAWLLESGRLAGGAEVTLSI